MAEIFSPRADPPRIRPAGGGQRLSRPADRPLPTLRPVARVPQGRFIPIMREPALRTTLPEMLRSLGYRTACIGKWHLGWDWGAIRRPDVAPRNEGKGRVFPPEAFDWSRPIPGGPLAHGFDLSFGDDVPNFPPYAWFENDRVVTPPTVDLNISREPAARAPAAMATTLSRPTRRSAAFWTHSISRGSPTTRSSFSRPTTGPRPTRTTVFETSGIAAWAGSVASNATCGRAATRCLSWFVGRTTCPATASEEVPKGDAGW